MRAIEFITERIEAKPFTKDIKSQWFKPFDRVVLEDTPKFGEEGVEENFEIDVIDDDKPKGLEDGFI